jgi:hypothetical protein
MNNRYYPNPARLEIGHFCLKGCWTLLLGGVLLGMSYLWLYSQVVQTSNAVESHENKLDYLRDRSVTLQSRLETLQSPRSIARMLEEKEIALAGPDPNQIVRVRREEIPAAEKSPRASSPRDLVILSIAR